jgi:uncharacterized membrane protein YsdA (DUF1294 family)
VIRVLVVWLLIVNAAAFVVFWWDKRRARQGGRRVSERELLTWALVGGSPGAFLAMRRFRHKTRKLSFRVMFWGVVVLQVAVAWLVLRAG